MFKRCFSVAFIAFTVAALTGGCKVRRSTAEVKDEFSSQNDTLLPSESQSVAFGQGFDTGTSSMRARCIDCKDNKNCRATLPERASAQPAPAGGQPAPTGGPAPGSAPTGMQLDDDEGESGGGGGEIREGDFTAFEGLPEDERDRITRLVDNTSEPTYIDPFEVAWVDSLDQADNNGGFNLGGEEYDKCKGQSLCLEFSLFESAEKTTSSLNAAAKAAFKSFYVNGEGSVSGGTATANERKTSFLVTRMRFVSGQAKEEEFFMTLPAVNLLKRENAKKIFQETCGNRYVRNGVYGGELYLFAIFDSLTEESKRELAASLKLASSGKFKAIGQAEVSASINTASEAMKKVSQSRVTSFERGGTLMPALDLPSALSKLSTFAEAKPVALLYTLADYSGVVGPNGDFVQFPEYDLSKFHISSTLMTREESQDFCKVLTEKINVVGKKYFVPTRNQVKNFLLPDSDFINLIKANNRERIWTYGPDDKDNLNNAAPWQTYSPFFETFDNVPEAKARAVCVRN